MPDYFRLLDIPTLNCQLDIFSPTSLNHEVFGNFRPISNLKVVSKIIEKVVAVRLNHYLELNHLNEPLQSAYKRFHSCETVLVRVHNDILRAIDNRHCVVLLLLDLSAAFDTVYHSILLERLYSKFAIRGSALNWFKSYLTDRSQCVSINEEKSEIHEPECGVPPGSVLGPIYTYFILHRWLTSCDSIKCHFIYMPTTHSYMYLF